MLCHIITQIINTDGVMMRFAYDKCSSMDYLDLPFLKSLASDCLFSQRDITIVLDGLDEAKDNEPENVLKWCLYELLRMAPSRGCRIRLLICGQEDGRIEPLLSSYPQIRLHTADLHRKDIEEYCKGQASVIRNRFRLSCDDENDLILKVSEAAKGMNKEGTLWDIELKTLTLTKECFCMLKWFYQIWHRWGQGRSTKHSWKTTSFHAIWMKRKYPFMYSYLTNRDTQI